VGYSSVADSTGLSPFV